MAETKYTLKGVNFQKCDERLVADIIKFQEENGLPTFIAAVRQLCSEGLKSK